ncbi:hypothetical protein COCON_G00119640, partial [Conger conger]
MVPREEANSQSVDVQGGPVAGELSAGQKYRRTAGRVVVEGDAEVETIKQTARQTYKSSRR